MNLILVNYKHYNKCLLGFDFMNLISPSGSNYQEHTDKFARYYRLIKNELFELQKERAMDIMEEYDVRIIIIMKTTNKI